MKLEETLIEHNINGETCQECGKDIPAGTSYYKVEFSAKGHTQAFTMCVECVGPQPNK